MTPLTPYNGLTQDLMKEAVKRFKQQYYSALAYPEDSEFLRFAIACGKDLADELTEYYEAIELAWERGRIQIDGVQTGILWHLTLMALVETRARIKCLEGLQGYYG